MRRCFSLTLALALFLMSGCGVTARPDITTDVSYGVLLHDLELYVGEFAQIPCVGLEGELTWTSDHPDVVRTGSRLIEALCPGTAVITVTDGTYTGTCTVTVKEGTPGDYTMRFLSNRETIAAGKSKTLKLEYTDHRAGVWYSSDPAVATVQNGTVTAIAPGTAVITFTNGVSTTQCQITVPDPAK